MSANKTIWITRPQGQADELASALEKSGVNVRQLPMLAIEPLPLNESIKSKVMNLDNYDLLFFISTNAANLGMALIDNYWPQFPVQLAIYSVGPSTASVIESYGQTAQFPASRMSSEALLELDSLAYIKGKKALIVRGEGGRELLAQALKERGAVVDYLELYRRICPEYAPGELNALFNSDAPAAVVVTSAEALANLGKLMKQEKLPLNCFPLFVSSARIAEIAEQAGFGRTITMPGADDKAIIDSLAVHLEAQS